MEIIVRKPVRVSETEYKLELCTIDDIRIADNVDSILSIDGSTTCSGVSILDNKGLILYLLAFKRTDNETPVQYKVRFKRGLYDIIYHNKAIKNIYYEEPFFNPKYVHSAKILFMLRTSVEELIEEYSPDLNYIKLTEVSNKRWKKLFLAPDKCPSGTEEEKAAVRKKLVSLIPVMDDVTQDEIDATALGFTAVWQKESHKEKDLESRPKTREFKYNIEFIGAESDEDALEDLEYIIDKYKIPENLVNNCEMYNLPGKGRFEDLLYRAMGDEDKLLILAFSSGKYGNIVLSNNIGNLAKQYSTIYAVCWRKNRKK